MTTLHTITAHDNIGWQAYPFLKDFPEWTITASALADAPEPNGVTLRWVKDDKVMDLNIAEMGTPAFLQKTGLRFTQNANLFVQSKRLSRIMSPFTYWGFFEDDEVDNPLDIQWSDELDADVWDGAGLMNRAFLPLLAENLPDSDEGDILRRELMGCERFEVTVMTKFGQEKGHVIVSDTIEADFLFPADSTKTEISLEGAMFVGLRPVHSRDDMRIDVQSLVNLHPFFSVENLLGWMHDESDLFLTSIREGEIETILGRMDRFEHEHTLNQFRSWYMGEYLASGGRLMWFAGAIKAMARQHSQRILNAERKLRLPMPGGRYYILPDVVGNRHVPAGRIELCSTTATAWVNDQDYINFLVEVLGGADGDDAVWVFPFTDKVDGNHKILMWRSPNQMGEYVVLRPTAESHAIRWQTNQGEICYPQMDSSLLPARIDNQTRTYGTLHPFTLEDAPTAYSVDAMGQTIAMANYNLGVLGGYCNMLLLTKATTGTYPAWLPARLEDVIDGSVKKALDLTPVMGWLKDEAQRLVNAGIPIPKALFPRLIPSLSQKMQARVKPAQHHWISTLLHHVKLHIESYNACVEALVAEATPPAMLFERNHHWQQEGVALRKAWLSVVIATGAENKNGKPNFEDATATALAHLSTYPEAQRRNVVMAMAAAVYKNAGSDALLWHSDMTATWFSALRMIGVLGEPHWDGYKAERAFRFEETDLATPLQLNGVWFNWLKTRHQGLQRMGQVSKEMRQTAKDWVASQDWTGFNLTTSVLDNDRVVAHTPHGNLFGFVQRGQETNGIRHQAWQIAHATVVDGNLKAVLMPA